MPKRTDIHTILLIGSGPIVIGQACEFDYSGSQACKALRREGYRVVLVNSNPATIMTDPELADATYIEPLTVEAVTAVIARERPDALLPTMGGQTGLNLACALARAGVLQDFGVELLGASVETIERAEDRLLFRQAMEAAGLDVLRSRLVCSVAEAEAFARAAGYPVVVRPSFTLGGSGGGIAYNHQDLLRIVERGLAESPVHTVLVEESALGWKEFELELMRDRAGNVVVVCSIENLDPMGVHTGDSITVAPAQTLTDREYQAMRNAAIACMQAIGVETGGANVQFAVEPRTGRMVIVEMNPRVSRSSALASKATGYPIAKVAALVAVGYTLDEIPNDITKSTPASFEPAIDYCVVKVPRFDFAKFPGADPTLGTQMKAVGEVMAIGRTFNEALQKALRSLEVGWPGLVGLATAEPGAAGAGSPGSGASGPGSGGPVASGSTASGNPLRAALRNPSPERLALMVDALRRGVAETEICRLTGIDPWFVAQIGELVREEDALRAAAGVHDETGQAQARGWSRPERLWRLKRLGFSDAQIAGAVGQTEAAVRAARLAAGVRPAYKLVDTCAGEFEAHTPYFYSTYERESEARRDHRPSIVILGAGPNRIGQGLEFDYCCVQAALAARELGYAVAMVNCNPETVSTDYDTSDRLYFEPLTLEDVLHVVEVEKPVGVIVQFGGQTPLKLAMALKEAGVPILGTSPESIHLAEDREAFQGLLQELGLKQAPGVTVHSVAEAKQAARRLGYPVLVRPSYVLGGRAMEIAYHQEHLERYVAAAAAAAPGQPILIDTYLRDAIELDVDAVSDGQRVTVGGILEHIEEAGVHSGDSACSLPATRLPASVAGEVVRQVQVLAKALKVVGLMNVQFAWTGDGLYVLEVNPRASRTVPFVSKAVGVPLARVATQAMLGVPLDLPDRLPEPREVAVKETVFPFGKFDGVDPVLGPEMRSTGEVMAWGNDLPTAYWKAQAAAGARLPSQGTVYFHAGPARRGSLLPAARQLQALGFSLWAEPATAAFLRAQEVAAAAVGEGAAAAAMGRGEVQLLVSLPDPGESPRPGGLLRQRAVRLGVPLFTTGFGAQLAAQAIAAWRERGGWQVRSMQKRFKLWEKRSALFAASVSGAASVGGAATVGGTAPAGEAERAGGEETARAG